MTTKTRAPTKPLEQDDLTPDQMVKFWSETEKVEESGCVLWTGATTKSGYGQFYVASAKKPYSAHRIAYVLIMGEDIPAGNVVRHRCGVRECIQPDHLDIGTMAENAADALEHGTLYGRGRPHLTEDEVREIRALRETGATLEAIASKFERSIPCISRVVSRQTFASVE